MIPHRRRSRSNRLETILQILHTDTRKTRSQHPKPCFCVHAHPGCQNDRQLTGMCTHPSISESLRGLTTVGLSEKEIASVVAQVFPKAISERDHDFPSPRSERRRLPSQKILLSALSCRRRITMRRAAESFPHNDSHNEIRPSNRRVSQIRTRKNRVLSNERHES